jgi:hypothetical protein
MDESRAGLGLRAAFFAGHGKTGLDDCTEAELQEYRAFLNKMDDALSAEVMAASRARRRFHTPETPEHRAALRREAEEDAAELPALLEEDSRSRPRLGFDCCDGRRARLLLQIPGVPDEDGVLVQAVKEGSPAAAAGLEQGDYIVQVDGDGINGPLCAGTVWGPSREDLEQIVDDLPPGATLALEFLRGTETLTVTVAPA